MHQAFLADLLRWLENNIDYDISVHDIVQRSGYSAAQLHRIFKSNVGCSLNDYLRNKRLQRCAYALKYTTIKISELSRRYHYANQQSFTRFFKEFYGVTPMEYRRNTELEFKQLFAWKHRNEVDMAGCSVDYVSMKHCKLFGISASYELATTEIGRSHIISRSAAENEFQQRTQRPVSEIFTLCRPVRRSTPMISYDYHIGTRADLIDTVDNLIPLPELDGDYLKFNFSNNQLSPFEMGALAYWGILSPNNLKRRDGFDMEHFDFSANPDILSYVYTLYIPVIFDDNLVEMLLKLRER